MHFSIRGKNLDVPARAVPVEQLDHFIARGGRTIGEQTPFDRLDIGGRINFACNKSGRLDLDDASAWKFHPLGPQLLANLAAFFVCRAQT
jgi:hypothetical protein